MRPIETATLSVEQCADYLGVSKFSIYRWINSPEGFPPVVRFGKRYRISVEKLHEYLANGGAA
jgi:excisionase family DNA binding protein